MRLLNLESILLSSKPLEESLLIERLLERKDDDCLNSEKTELRATCLAEGRCDWASDKRGELLSGSAMRIGGLSEGLQRIDLSSNCDFSLISLIFFLLLLLYYCFIRF